MNSWLRDAYAHNAKFMEKTKVDHVIIEDGRVQGVEIMAHYDRKMTIRADKVVVSGGSLQSPGVLLRSGLTNKNIGKNLKLHPCSITLGFFDKSITTSEGSIMTAISDVAENEDNEGYGAKLEVPLVHPGCFSSVLPWRGAAHHKDLMARYDTCSPILILSRDKDSNCSVRYNEHNDFIIDFELSPHDRQSIMAGIKRSLFVLAAAGARELHTGQFSVEPFVFNGDEESSVENTRFLEWIDQVEKTGLSREKAGFFGAHQMSSNRMGVSSKTSVTKPTGETWEVKNLYVADASILPTATGVNPMVTTEAVSSFYREPLFTPIKSSKMFIFTLTVQTKHIIEQGIEDLIKEDDEEINKKTKIMEDEIQLLEGKVKLWDEKANILQQSNARLVTLIENERQIRANETTLTKQKSECSENNTQAKH
ncbi:hypothetical protein K501DRAFT_266167 [Backusella circina FSU 941]|nr:hypothetical protein K501DRAFT_266167 [Backusella circina FSU 941]